MPILQIQHEDGRLFNVAESAFKDLYEPFGFKATGVVYGGTVEAYTQENLDSANAYEAAGLSPNDTAYTFETASNQARSVGQDNRANELEEKANALHKAPTKGGYTTNPKNKDSAMGEVLEEEDLPGPPVDPGAPVTPTPPTDPGAPTPMPTPTPTPTPTDPGAPTPPTDPRAPARAMPTTEPVVVVNKSTTPTGYT